MLYFRTRLVEFGVQTGRGFRQGLRALRSRNYRLFFMGQSISLIGLWIQRVALSWLVYRITLSPLSLGFVDFIGQIPIFFLTLLTGVWLERWDLRKLLLITQWMAVAQALVLAALTLSGTILYWHIVILSTFLGVVNSFDMPARQAFVVQLVDRKDDLGNAIALNSSLFNSARLIGPSIAGIAIAAVGEGICFLVNGLSYLGTIAALRAIRVPPRDPSIRPKPGLSGVIDGLEYAFNFPPIKALLILLTLLSLFGMPYLVMLPVFAKEVLGGGPKTLGYLLASTGVGALGGTIFLALRKSPIGLGKVATYATALFGVALSLFSMSRIQLLSISLMPLVGFGMVLSVSSCNTLIQTLVDEHMRRRVMSLYVVSLVGTGPVGSLLAGAAANLFGAPLTLFIGGLVCVGVSFIFYRNLPGLRALALPLLKEKGYS